MMYDCPLKRRISSLFCVLLPDGSGFQECTEQIYEYKALSSPGYTKHCDLQYIHTPILTSQHLRDLMVDVGRVLLQV